jgi:hypothetical protein
MNCSGSRVGSGYSGGTKHSHKPEFERIVASHCGSLDCAKLCLGPIMLWRLYPTWRDFMSMLRKIYVLIDEAGDDFEFEW